MGLDYVTLMKKLSVKIFFLLQVHFGHDSLLQTPNVNQVKKRREGVTTIKEEADVKTNGTVFHDLL